MIKIAILTSKDLANPEMADKHMGTWKLKNGEDMFDVEINNTIVIMNGKYVKHRLGDPKDEVELNQFINFDYTPLQGN
ncbi:hypothetical protein [Lonepinella sp. BR2474]|uniref:hypothetical protein n=1 Tax=Lonepinella sp. BR2474 TaxID=3434548 RepID=UPI003F6DD766